MAATPTPAPSPTGVAGALAFVHSYEDALIAGNYPTAWAMLGSGSQEAGWGTLTQYTSERKAFMTSAGKTYSAVANPSGVASISDWLSGTGFAPSIDVAHAVLVQVTWTALANNNAGMEMWVVNPIAGGWALYEVR
ncbi:MAG: hypothetical protein ACHQ01_00940 [Candidatus Limnocylindrales bacterium]